MWLPTILSLLLGSGVAHADPAQDAKEAKETAEAADAKADKALDRSTRALEMQQARRGSAVLDWTIDPYGNVSPDAKAAADLDLNDGEAAFFEVRLDRLFGFEGWAEAPTAEPMGPQVLNRTVDGTWVLPLQGHGLYVWHPEGERVGLFSGFSADEHLDDAVRDSYLQLDSSHAVPPGGKLVVLRNGTEIFRAANDGGAAMGAWKLLPAPGPVDDETEGGVSLSDDHEEVTVVHLEGDGVVELSQPGDVQIVVRIDDSDGKQVHSVVSTTEGDPTLNEDARRDLKECEAAPDALTARARALGPGWSRGRVWHCPVPDEALKGDGAVLAVASLNEFPGPVVTEAQHRRAAEVQLQRIELMGIVGGRVASTDIAVIAAGADRVRLALTLAEGAYSIDGVLDAGDRLQRISVGDGALDVAEAEPTFSHVDVSFGVIVRDEARAIRPAVFVTPQFGPKAVADWVQPTVGAGFRNWWKWGIGPTVGVRFGDADSIIGLAPGLRLSLVPGVHVSGGLDLGTPGMTTRWVAGRAAYVGVGLDPQVLKKAMEASKL